MYVGDFGMLLGELGQLEVMRREQRQAAVPLDQFACDRGSERHAVERRRTAADLIHQHQAGLGRAVEDRGRFRHFHHEGRAAARQVVGGTDPGQDPIDRTEPRARGGTKLPA